MSSTLTTSYDDSSGAGIFGAIVGFAIGGPIGAVIGGALASGSSSSSSYSSYDYEAERRRERQRQENERKRQKQLEREREQREWERQQIELYREEQERERRQRELERERREREREAERQRKIEAERKRKLEQERRRIAAESWKTLQCELKKEITSFVQSEPERRKLLESIANIESPYIKAMNDGNTYAAEDVVSRFRKKIISVQADEELTVSRQGELSEYLSALSREAPVGFSEEINSIRKQNVISSSISIDEQSKRIKSLFSEAQKLAGEISQASSISLGGITEQTFIIPPVTSVVDKSYSSESTELLQDICDFGGRVAFYDEATADDLKPLIAEASNGSEISRLKLIRSQIKTTYNKLREQAVLTAMFKRDIRDFLSPMRKAHNTDALCLRMEELLTAPVVSRDEYNSVYKEVKAVLVEQLDYIAEAVFAEKISETLLGLGYTLLDENGNPANLTPGQVRMIDTPYEGYRVRVKVGQNNTVVTRLVRVVSSEDEKSSVSEYQLQQDIETGQKWCKDVQNFYDALKEDGIAMTVKFSKEPGDEPLDVVVDESAKKTVQRGKSTEYQTGGLQSRKIGE